ncbi:MAG: DUF1292 domain-containing protein [Lachnospiraceae bacterium]|nr:DUF1292 domain-containing protein [Lachnospiraceae bacterium]
MSEQEPELLYFEDEDGNQEIFEVVETTTIMGVEYLMVQDAVEEEDEEETPQAYIMKKVGDKEDDVFYEFVEDEDELESVFKVFEELLEDIDFL